MDNKILDKKVKKLIIFDEKNKKEIAVWKKEEMLKKITDLSEKFIQEMKIEGLNYDEMVVLLKKVENEYGYICKK